MKFLSMISTLLSNFSVPPATYWVFSVYIPVFFCLLLLHVLHIIGIIHLLRDPCLYMYFHDLAYFAGFESCDMVCSHAFAII